MGRTFVLLRTALSVQVALGLGIALLLHEPGLTLAETLCRLSLVLPMATTYAVVGLLGQVMFNQKFGVVNEILGGADVDWIGDPTNAFVTIVFWDFWQRASFVALVLLAGLAMVPSEVEEFISLMIQGVGFRAFDRGLASAQALILLVVTIVLARSYIRVFHGDA